MKSEKNSPFAVGVVLGLVLSAFAGQALAEGANPVTLILSETVSRDTNLTRTTEARPDVSSQTDVKLKLDKPYGRQYYSASGRFGVTRFKNNKQFDNNNYDVDASIASEVASNWSFSLNGSASQNLNSGSNAPINARLEKNIVSIRDGGFNLRYGVSGRWSMVGSLGVNRLSYSSELQKFQDRDQTSQGLRLVYATSDLLNFSVGGSQAISKYPNSFISAEGEEVTQRSVDLGTDWQVTGFSSLNGTVSFVRNSYKTDDAANYSAVTSRINWNFTPRGLVTYNLSFARTTDSDNSLTNQRSGVTAPVNTFIGILDLPANMVYDNVTTSLAGSARWTPTAKLGFTLGGAWYDYKIKRNLSLVSNFNGNVSLVNPESESDASHLTQISLAGDYRYSRLLGFTCSIQRYKQTADFSRLAYDGNVYGCNANLTLN